MASVKVFITHDNIFSLRIMSNSSPVNLINTAVSRVVVTSTSLEVDSSLNPESFDYSTDGVDGVIHFDFADLTGLAPGTYRCRLTIYDAIHPNGQVWRDKFELVIRPRVVQGA